MNWDAIGAIGEIVGALAVVVSLTFLAFQIRAQNKESRLNAAREVVNGQRESIQLFLQPGIAEDFIKALSDFEGTTPPERLRFTMILMDVWKMSQAAYLQMLADRLDDEVWKGFHSQLSDLMANDPCRQVWRIREHQFDRRFRDLVNDLDSGKLIYDVGEAT